MTDNLGVSTVTAHFSVFTSIAISLAVASIYFASDKVINSVSAQEVRQIIQLETAPTLTDLRSIQNRISRMSARLGKMETHLQDQRVLLVQILQSQGISPILPERN